MPTDSESINAAFELRSRYMRRVQQNRTADERLAVFARMQQAAFRALRDSPLGYQHFLRRNMESRRVEVVDGVWRPVSSARRAQFP